MVAPSDIGLSPPKLRDLPLEIGVVAIAFPLGILEYQILKPSPMVEFSFQVLVAPALVFIVCSGFLEELVFRGLMQFNAMRLARFHGILFVLLA